MWTENTILIFYETINLRFYQEDIQFILWFCLLEPANNKIGHKSRNRSHTQLSPPSARKTRVFLAVSKTSIMKLISTRKPVKKIKARLLV